MEFLRHHYKGLLLFICGILLAVFLSQNSLLQSFLLHLGGYGYLGAFIAGILVVSTLTMPTAILILIALGHYLSPVEISIIAGLGATLGNYIIFHFINRKIARHIRSFYKSKSRRKHHKTLSSYTHFLIPFLGVLILASPFPDELGILLLSIFNMRTYQFLFLSFVLKCISIFLVVSTINYIA